MKKILLVLCIILLIVPTLFAEMMPAETGVSLNPEYQINSDIAIGPDQTIYVIWTNSSSFEEDGLYLKKSTDGGYTFSPAVLVTESLFIDCAFIFSPRIQVFGSGSAASVYISYWVNNGLITTPQYVVFQRSLDGGTTFDSGTIIDSSDVYLGYYNLDMDVDPLNYVYISYTYALSKLFLRVSSDGGTSFAPRLTIQDNVDIQIYDVALAVQGAGETSTAHIAWDLTDNETISYWEIWYRAVENAGSAGPSLQTSQQVTPTATSRVLLNRGGMAVSLTGRVFITYFDDLNGIVLVDYIDYPGLFSQTPDTIITFRGNDRHPRIDLDGKGNPFIVLQSAEHAEGYYDIYLSYSRNAGLTYEPAFLVNHDTLHDQKLPAIAIWAQDCQRWINLVWQGDQAGENYDIYYTGLRQFKNTVKPRVAPGGFSISNFIDVDYTSWLFDYTQNMKIGYDSLTAWFDAGTPLIASQLGTGSTSTQRWIINPTSYWFWMVDSCGPPIILTYYHQFLVTAFVTTLAPGLPMSAANYIPLLGTAFGITGEQASIWDGHVEPVWLDRLSPLRIDTLSTASDAAQRWIVEDGTVSSYTVLFSATYFLRYYHQQFCDITLYGTDTGHTVEITDRIFYGIPALEGGLSGRWADWLDYLSGLTFTDTTTGVPPYWTAEVTSWTITAPRIDTLHYMPTTCNINFTMTVLSPYCIAADWDDFFDETAYIINNHEDTTLVEGSDTLPANNLTDTICGLGENSFHRWFVIGTTNSGNRYSFSDSAYTLCDNPTGAAVLDSGADYAVLKVDPFPNHSMGNSAYFWDCIDGEGFGGRDTVFRDGTVIWLLDGLIEGRIYTYVVYYRNGAGIQTPVGDTVTVFISGPQVCLFEGLHRFWNLVSISVIATPSSPVQIFQDDIYPFLLTPINSNLYDFDEPTHRYFVPSEMEVGHGYWLYLWHLVGVDITGRATSMDFHWDLSYTDDLAIPGWQLLGNPYTNRPVDWNSILAHPQTQSVDSTYYAWDAQWQSWAFYAPWFPGGVSNLIPPWRGIEVRAKNEGAALYIAYPMAFPRALPPDENGALADVKWFLKISPESDVSYDPYNYLINAKGAKPSLDKYDFYERPPMGESYTCLYFPQYDPGLDQTLNFTTFSNDFELYGSQKDIIFRVQTNSSEEITLTWHLEGNPSPGQNIFLEDLITGQIIDMTARDNYSYNPNPNLIVPANIKNLLGARGFVFGDDDCHDFRIILENHRYYSNGQAQLVPQKSEILSVFPNPFNSLTRIEYAIPESNTGYSLYICDILGNLTRTLVTNNTGSGYLTAVWEGEQDNGHAAPSGLYFCILEQGVRKEIRKVFLLR
ncbi:T9SS type A sorting domain-containing protein [bacterium]|nr:T9SS type A sorting domain-containing protein [bacterium]